VELDIMIGDISQQGKGYGQDALKAMINYAFTQQKAERVFIMPRVTNKRAIHVYEKVGFKKEGVLRHYEKFEGLWIDSLMMAILRDEFKQLR
jgi:RimJ/RimL family protein N-acetyltransferase